MTTAVSSAASPSVVLDANVFLHFEWFENIDWPALARAPAVVLVITRTTVSEMDRHKFSGTPRVRELAKRVVARWYEIVGKSDRGRVKPNVELWFPQTTVPDEIYTHAALDRTVPDDRIIAEVLTLLRAQQLEPLTIYTADFGMLLAAQHHKLPCEQMPEQYKREPEPDETERELKKLQRELAEERSKRPVFRVIHLTGQQFLNVHLRHKPIISNVDISRRCAMRRQECRAALRTDRSNRSSLFGSSSMNPLTTRRLEAAESYLRDYDAFLRKLQGYQQASARFFLVELRLLNEGAAAGDDIDVTVTFPDDLTVRDKPLEEPEQPPVPYDIQELVEGDKPPPREPRHFAAMLAGLGAPMVTIPRDEPPEFVLSETTARYHVRRLKQGDHKDLLPLHVARDSIENRKGFSFKVDVKSAVPPVSAPSELHVTFKEPAAP